MHLYSAVKQNPPLQEDCGGVTQNRAFSPIIQTVSVLAPFMGQQRFKKKKKADRGICYLTLYSAVCDDDKSRG